MRGVAVAERRRARVRSRRISGAEISERASGFAWRLKNVTCVSVTGKWARPRETYAPKSNLTPLSVATDICIRVRVRE